MELAFEIMVQSRENERKGQDFFLVPEACAWFKKISILVFIFFRLNNILNVYSQVLLNDEICAENCDIR